jgi:hypothetical protein
MDSYRKAVLGTQNNVKQWPAHTCVPFHAVLDPSRDGPSSSMWTTHPAFPGNCCDRKLLLSAFPCVCLALQRLNAWPRKRGQLGSAALASAVPWQPASPQSPLITDTRSPSLPPGQRLPRELRLLLEQLHKASCWEQIMWDRSGEGRRREVRREEEELYLRGRKERKQGDLSF